MKYVTPETVLLHLPREKPSRAEVAYGLLWMITTDDKRIHEARRLLLETMDKDGQVIGIKAARNVAPLCK